MPRDSMNMKNYVYFKKYAEEKKQTMAEIWTKKKEAITERTIWHIPTM